MFKYSVYICVLFTSSQLIAIPLRTNSYENSNRKDAKRKMVTKSVNLELSKTIKNRLEPFHMVKKTTPTKKIRVELKNVRNKKMKPLPNVVTNMEHGPTTPSISKHIYKELPDLRKVKMRARKISDQSEGELYSINLLPESESVTATRTPKSTNITIHYQDHKKIPVWLLVTIVLLLFIVVTNIILCAWIRKPNRCDDISRRIKVETGHLFVKDNSAAIAFILANAEAFDGSQ